MKVKMESEKVGFKLNIQKTKIMASSPITSWLRDWTELNAIKVQLKNVIQLVQRTSKVFSKNNP